LNVKLRNKFCNDLAAMRATPLLSTYPRARVHLNSLRKRTRAILKEDVSWPTEKTLATYSKMDRLGSMAERMIPNRRVNVACPQAIRFTQSKFVSFDCLAPVSSLFSAQPLDNSSFTLFAEGHFSCPRKQTFTAVRSRRLQRC
jgi:hypothetical protein